MTTNRYVLVGRFASKTCASPMQLQATIEGCVILASACFSISLNNLNEKSRFYRGSRIDSSLSSLPASSWLCTKADAEFVVDTRLLYQEKANLDSYSRFHWLANGARLIFGDSLVQEDSPALIPRPTALSRLPE